MADVPITEFGMRQVEEAYKALKTEPLMMGAIGLATAIAVYLILQRYAEAISKVGEGGNPAPRAKEFTDLIWKLGTYTLIIVGMPFFIYFIEAILADLQEGLIRSLGGEPKGYVDTAISEMEAMYARYPTGPSIFDPWPDIWEYIIVLFVKPTLAWAVRYLYAMAISVRYLYLLLLEIMAPVAIVMKISPKTEGHFWAWLKHMMVCYLMIPAFIAANALGDTIVLTIFDDPYTLLGVLANFFLKLFLLRSAKDLVFKLL